MEARLRQLEGRAVNKSASLAKAAAVGSKGAPKAHDAQRVGAAPALLTTPKSYNADADVPTEKKKKKKAEAGGAEAAAAEGGEEEDAAAKAARKAARKAAKAAAAGAEAADEEEAPPKAKKAKKAKE